MELHPFAADRQIGVVHRIEGLSADITLSAADRLPRSHFGEYLSRGEVGLFVLIDAGGVAVFGRVTVVGLPPVRPSDVAHNYSRIPAEARVQLLSTLQLDGQTSRGVAKYPKLGDPVYTASAEAVAAVLVIDAGSGAMLPLGRLSIDESVPVAVPVDRLFGRHLAIVGATGSGKSWTLGHLAERITHLRGKMILIDATGEFKTLGGHARHLAFGNADDEPVAAHVVGIPHFMMREADRNTFVNPSGGVQLPKMREAVRSLRLATAIQNDPFADDQHRQLVRPDGAILKTGASLAVHRSAVEAYIDAVEGAHSEFNIRLLAQQVQHECIFPTGQGNSNVFGGINNNELGYVGTLISRITDLLQIKEIMEVIDPQEPTANAFNVIEDWICDPNSHLLRISLRNLTFANHLREIVVNILGQQLLTWARAGRFADIPVVVAVDEAHQFFDVVVGDEFANTHLNAFDAIAKEGRKYGLTVCLATQRPGDLPPGVLSQVGMTIVHRLADGRDRQRVEQAAAELDHSATRLLPGLVPGEALLMGVDFPVPVSVRINRPASPPNSDGPRYGNWGLQPPTPA